jgi:hypothetical protein
MYYLFEMELEILDKWKEERKREEKLSRILIELIAAFRAAVSDKKNNWNKKIGKWDEEK